MGSREKRDFAVMSLSLALLLLLAVALAFPTYSAAADTPQSTPRRKRSTSAGPPPPVSDGLGSSAIFRIEGNVYPRGLYYVSLDVGNPSRTYFLDIDTGSDLTWIQCDAPCTHCWKGPNELYKPIKNRIIFCKDPLCASVPTIDDYRCKSPDEQCSYWVEYADQGSSLGVVVQDTFSLIMANGSHLQPNLAFGCGYDQNDPSATSAPPTDGVLGLGNGKSSIVSQLRDQGLTRAVIGHCLSGGGGGYLFFGDGILPSSGVTWTPMSHDASHKYYSPGPTKIVFGKKSMKNLKVAFDSGSSFTYFSSQAYQTFLVALREELSLIPRKPLKEAVDDRTLPLCWKGSRKFKSLLDVKKYFKPLTLIFGKKASLEIPPEGYLIISSKGNVCLGILNGTEIGLGDFNIIGDISLQDTMVIYDNEKQQIGWVRTNCSRLPNVDDNDDGGFSAGYSNAYIASMGILSAEYPATYDANRRV